LARSVPPLNPLYVFEVASRVGSFTKAAEILNVTPSAVSRQIAALEAFLDVRLFNRGRDGNTLTDVGDEFYRGIAPAFDTITSMTERIKKLQSNTPLNVRVPSTFAVRFLIPRLCDFRAIHPEVSIRIVTGFGPVDFVREEVDISIQVGEGDWPGSEGRLLFHNWVQPMCSPRLVADRPVRSIDDLIGLRLLVSKNRRTEWRNWATAMGRPDFPPESVEVIEFPNSMLAYQAATNGLGVVIGHVPLLGTDLAARLLVPLLSEPIRQGSYYAVWRAETGPSRKGRHFVSWLQQQLDELPMPVPASAAAE
jgi:LysR family glycine cleavage system transcriptional activator